MPLYDFYCQNCDNRFEEMVPYTERGAECPKCKWKATREVPATHSFTTIVVTHPDTKKNKAGYQHLFQNRPAEKISVQVPGKK